MQAVLPADLQTYLGLPEVDTDRAQMLIDDAVAQALSIVTVGTVPEDGATIENLPVGAESVIRAAVARLYLNPSGVTQEGAGSFTLARPAGSGSMFSTAERRTLRRFGGGGGAFTVDLLPSTINDSIAELPWWDADTESLPTTT